MRLKLGGGGGGGCCTLLEAALLEAALLEAALLEAALLEAALLPDERPPLSGQGPTGRRAASRRCFFHGRPASLFGAGWSGRVVDRERRGGEGGVQRHSVYMWGSRGHR
ncbi:hypothetical protein NHX12_033520 [Muraenolepis orangiensis]|uniref:Uncharacterized protein n=1 Tax=Muraenolepis orangiensis TaxID=630683 RepID=A0A9Q0IJR4_9TELE|nr:hypothetical protein NHX12_033520 [Muraenolepis orangiensis]